MRAVADNGQCTSVEAARYVAHLEGDMSHLRAQKLLYLSHMFRLGESDKPLIIGDRLEAWRLGPVFVALYYELKSAGNHPIKPYLSDREPIKSEKAKEYLQLACDLMRPLTTGQLVGVTHERGWAWSLARESKERNAEIPEDEIKNDYRRFLKAYGAPTS